MSRTGAWATCGALLAALVTMLSSGPVSAAAQAAHRFFPPRDPSAGFVAYDAAALDGARYSGPADLGSLSVDVLLQMRNPVGLRNFAFAAANPRSPLYRHFLTPRQIGAYFGAPPRDQSEVAAYFSHQGLATQTWPQREVVRVVGRQADMERAFGTRFGIFRKGTRVFYAPVSPPRLSQRLPVAGVSRLVGYNPLHRHLRVVSSQRLANGFANGMLAGYSPQQLAAAFDFTGAYNLGFSGRGITIGILGTGPMSAADVPTFRALFSVIGGGTVSQVNVTTVAPGFSSGLQTPPPVTPPCQGPLPGCNPEDVEAQLDTEQTSSLAPDANVLFYLAYNPNECRTAGSCGHNPPTPALGLDLLDDEIQQAIADNAADVISLSAGGGELDLVGGPFQADGTGLEPTEFASLAAEGIGVFASTGDTGAEGCQIDGIPSTADVLCAVYPATDPSITAVGGTTTPIGSDGRLLGPLVAWGLQTAVIGGHGATGGGLSAFFARPAYQNAVSAVVGAHRGVPDVAANADVFTGAATLLYADPRFQQNPGAILVAVGGTSVAAPDMAAMWALVLEACKVTPRCGFGPSAHPYRLGNPDQLMYEILSRPTLYPTSIYDVVYGNNASLNTLNPSTADAGYTAGPGYDLTTGIGAPYARNLIKAITGR